MKVRLLRIICLLLGVSLLVGCLAPAQQEGLDALNHDRAVFGLRPLNSEPDLQAKAQAWAETLAARGTLSHSAISSGIAGQWCRAGENVGYGPSIKVVEQAYMNSTTGHRENILGNYWTGAAVGVATARDGTVFTVQEFVKRGSCT